MKKFYLKILMPVIIISMLGLVITACAQAKDKDKKRATPATSSNVADIKQESVEKKLLYTFKDDSELTLFEQMYTAKQIINNRISVLQGYLSQEKANLDQIDGQMYVKFGFTMKQGTRYDLNRETKELRELK